MLVYGKEHDFYKISKRRKRNSSFYVGRNTASKNAIYLKLLIDFLSDKKKSTLSLKSARLFSKAY